MIYELVPSDYGLQFVAIAMLRMRSVIAKTRKPGVVTNPVERMLFTSRAERLVSEYVKTNRLKGE